MPVLNAVTMCFIGQMFVNALQDLSDESDEEKNDERSGLTRGPHRQYPRKNYSCYQHAQMLLNRTHLDHTSRDDHPLFMVGSDQSHDLDSKFSPPIDFCLAAALSIFTAMAFDFLGSRSTFLNWLHK